MISGPQSIWRQRGWQTHSLSTDSTLGSACSLFEKPPNHKAALLVAQSWFKRGWTVSCSPSSIKKIAHFQMNNVSFRSWSWWINIQWETQYIFQSRPLAGLSLTVNYSPRIRTALCFNIYRVARVAVNIHQIRAGNILTLALNPRPHVHAPSCQTARGYYGVRP